MNWCNILQSIRRIHVSIRKFIKISNIQHSCTKRERETETERQRERERDRDREWKNYLFRRTIFPGSRNWGKPPNTFSSSELLRLDRRNDYPLSSIAAAPPPWGKPSNLWTSYVYSLRPKVPSWIWIRWIQYATHRTTFSRLQYWLCRLRCKKSAPTSSYFISGQHFLEIFTLLPETTRTTNSRVTTTFLLSNSKHDFCYTNGGISHSHIQQCLNLTMHIFAQAFSC